MKDRATINAARARRNEVEESAGKVTLVEAQAVSSHPERRKNNSNSN